MPLLLKRITEAAFSFRGFRKIILFLNFAVQRHDIVFKGKQEMIWLLVLMLAWLTVG